MINKNILFANRFYAVLRARSQSSFINCRDNSRVVPTRVVPTPVAHSHVPCLKPVCCEYKFNNKQLDKIIKNLAEQIPDHSIIVSWSLGGLIALYLSYQFPRKCRKLILVSSSPKFISTVNWIGIEEETERRFHINAENNMQQLIKYFLQLVRYPNANLPIKSYLNAHLLEVEDSKNSLIGYLDLLINADFREFYRLLRMPVLHIFGGQDAIVPVRVADEIYQSDCIDIKIISAAGHVPFLTHQQEFINRLHEFLER